MTPTSRRDAAPLRVTLINLCRAAAWRTTPPRWPTPWPRSRACA